MHSSVPSGGCPYSQNFFSEFTSEVKCAPLVCTNEVTLVTTIDESFDDPYLTPKSLLEKLLRRKQRRSDFGPRFPSQLGELLDKTFDEYVARSLHKNSVHTPSTADETASPYASLSSKSIDSFPESVEISLYDVPHQSENTYSSRCNHNAVDRVDQYKTALRSKPSSPLILTNLGLAQMEVGDFPSAIGALAEAAQFWRKRRKPVALARALDRQGACLTALEFFDMALECFREAFSLRYKHLGPWHIDTIDSRKAMGHVYFVLRRVAEARNCFFEVFWVNKAIFQTDHLTVALSAYDLAKTMATEGLFDHARNFYRIAWNIYDQLKVSPSNPAVEQLLNDINHLTCLVRNKGS